MKLKHIPLSSLFLVAIACDPGIDDNLVEPGDPELAIDQSIEGVMGARNYQGTCNAEDVRFNEKATFYARIAANTAAFEQCLDTAMRTGFAGTGPYRKCNGDPYYSSAIGEQYTRALAAARSETGLSVTCSGGGGNASTSIGTYAHAGDESYSWGGWFRGVWSSIDVPYCGSIGVPGCRYAPKPWPYDQAAGIVWHEAMHQFGYTHGANDQENAKVNCGYSSDPSWHFQYNTLPYILGHCVSWVIGQSGQTCGDLETCGDGALRMINGASSTSCSCVSDPRPTVPATANFNIQNKAIVDFAGYISNSGVKVASGDFDGDGRTDLAAVGGTGWASIPVAFSRGDGSFHVTNNTVANFPGYATAASAKLIAGDFNKDGRDDLALTGVSGWTTLPVAFSVGDGNFNTTNLGIVDFAAWAPSGTPLAGDFDGDGATDIALVARSGATNIPIAFSNRDGTFRVVNEFVADFPGLSAQSGVRAVAGDFDGDGDDDIAIAGNPSWTTVPVAFSNKTGTFNVTNLGADYFTYYAAEPAARLRAADFDGDGKDDLVVAGGPSWPWTIHARSLGNGSFSASWRDVGGSFPSWANEGSVFAGDFNADGRADLALARIGGGGWASVPVALSVVSPRVGAEYNDHRDDATPAPTYMNEIGLSIGYRSDVDYYRFDVASTTSVWVYMTFTHSRGDLDVALLDANGTVVVSSTGVTNTEGFLRQVTPGRYYVKVYGYSGATGGYDLQIAR